MDFITEFRGDYRFLSNFYVEPDRTTVEHDFQAAKTNDLFEKVQILSAESPRHAKQLGRACTLRPDWEEVKRDVMRELVVKKFLDHPDLARALVATGDAILVEGNTWHDNYWGSCICEKCAPLTKANFNNLGIILMEVRDLINDMG